MSRRGTRGFTMLEMLVVIGIVAILAAIAIPALSRSREKQEHRSAAQRIVSDFARARSLAKLGAKDVAGWAPTDRTLQAGIRIVSATQYVVFVDSDSTPNNPPTDQVVEVVDLATSYTGFDFRITSPPVGTQIRFRRNGTLTQSADVDVVLVNTNGGSDRTVTVTYGGDASFR